MSRPLADFAQTVGAALIKRSSGPRPIRSKMMSMPSTSRLIRTQTKKQTRIRSQAQPQVMGAGYAGGLRALHTSSPRSHGEITRPAPGTGIKLVFKDSKGAEIKTIEGNEGDDILSLAHEYDVDLEGACEGSVACSTCHVVIDPEHYDMLPEPDDEENDMLDLAFGLEDTSRLGCQVKLTKELDGMTATLPSATRNMYVDGAKARTH
ncbi:adrenodoxin-type ferredoxin [Kwoniella heveanensis CBS 569]|nr:adrenodoxin-type ferredoxin [Kwoniella heveanensis CBS 569]